MRYIIKRRLSIRTVARWVKCLLQQRGQDQLCCQCSWIEPHMDQCVGAIGLMDLPTVLCLFVKPEIQSRSRPCHLCYHSKPAVNGFTWDLLVSKSHWSAISQIYIYIYKTQTQSKRLTNDITALTVCMLTYGVRFYQCKASERSTIFPSSLMGLANNM